MSWIKCLTSKAVMMILKAKNLSNSSNKMIAAPFILQLRVETLCTHSIKISTNHMHMKTMLEIWHKNFIKKWKTKPYRELKDFNHPNFNPKG